MEFGELVEEEHTVMRERDVSGLGQTAGTTGTTRECLCRGRVMGRTHRTADHARGLLALTERRPDTDDLQPFIGVERGQDGGKALGHHALARTGRAA